MRPADHPACRAAALALLGPLLLLAGAIAAHADGWDPALLPREARERLAAHATQWARMGAAERTAFDARRRDWDALPVAERGARRERYRAWRALTAAEQVAVQQARPRFEALAADAQAALRAQFDALDAAPRRGWLLGPALGADYAALQPLLAQLPDAEHPPLLATLRAMSAAQRAALAVLVQRTPPHERAALRRELVAARPATREAWLRMRLQR